MVWHETHRVFCTVCETVRHETRQFLSHRLFCSFCETVRSETLWFCLTEYFAHCETGWFCLTEYFASSVRLWDVSHFFFVSQNIFPLLWDCEAWDTPILSHRISCLFCETVRHVTGWFCLTDYFAPSVRLWDMRQADFVSQNILSLLWDCEIWDT